MFLPDLRAGVPQVQRKGCHTLIQGVGCGIRVCARPEGLPGGGASVQRWEETGQTPSSPHGSPAAGRTRAEHGLGSDSKYRALLQTKCHGGPVTPKSLVYLINSVKLLVSSVGKKPRRASSLADAGVCSA